MWTAIAIFGFLIFLFILVRLSRQLRIELKKLQYRAEFTFAKEVYLRQHQHEALRRWVEEYHFYEGQQEDRLPLKHDEWQDVVNAWAANALEEAEKDAEAAVEKWNSAPAWARWTSLIAENWLGIFVVLLVLFAVIFYALDAIIRLVQGG